MSFIVDVAEIDGDIPVCLRKRLLIYVLSEKCMSSAKLFTSLYLE